MNMKMIINFFVLLLWCFFCCCSKIVLFPFHFVVSLWKRNCKLPYSLSTISVEIYQSLIGNDLWSWAFYSTNEHVSCTFYYFRIISVCMLNGNKLVNLSRNIVDLSAFTCWMFNAVIALEWQSSFASLFQIKIWLCIISEFSHLSRQFYSLFASFGTIQMLSASFKTIQILFASFQNKSNDFSRLFFKNLTFRIQI
jgi:hypothetical protein